MPTVKVKGKTKKFPYTAKGEAAAKKAAQMAGASLEVKGKKKPMKKFGISNLKVG